MADSKFKRLQKDVCEIVAGPTEPDKICPTCQPNPSYQAPNWRMMGEPFLNEATCEYMVPVSLNSFGNFYTEQSHLPLQELVAGGRTLPNVNTEAGVGTVSFYENGEKLVDLPFDVLLKSYIRPGIRKLLRYYAKLETDEIVCATALSLEESQQLQSDQITQGAQLGAALGLGVGVIGAIPGAIIGGTIAGWKDRKIEPCHGIFGLNYEEFIEIREYNGFETVRVNPEISGIFPEIRNPEALELYGRAKDYDFIGPSKFLTVLVAIPAYIFDAVPAAPDLGSVNTSQNKVVYRTVEFSKYLDNFKALMKTFAGYQSYFHQTENGQLRERETNRKFYISFYANDRIDKFKSKLAKLLEDNGFKFPQNWWLDDKLGNVPFDIEISFDKSNEKKPFVVQNVRARNKDCPYEELKIGMQSFIEYSKSDQTMLGYVASLQRINAAATANETPPWLDFMVQYTFPQLVVDYGSSDKFQNNCPSLDFGKLDDMIFDGVLDFFDAVAYQMNKNKCKTIEELEAKRAEFRPNVGKDFLGINSALASEIYELDRDGNVKTKVNKDTGKTERVYKKDFAKIMKAFEKKKKQKPKNKNKKRQEKAAMGDVNIQKELAKILNPCLIKKLTIDAMKCAMASLSLDEVYHVLLKKMLSNVGEQALDILISRLDANTQNDIRKTVKEQFGDMPMPWDPGWVGGENKGVNDTAQAATDANVKKQQGASNESASLQSQIEELKRQLNSLKEMDTTSMSDYYSKEREIQELNLFNAEFEGEKLFEELDSLLREKERLTNLINSLEMAIDEFENPVDDDPNPGETSNFYGVEVNTAEAENNLNKQSLLNAEMDLGVIERQIDENLARRTANTAEEQNLVNLIAELRNSEQNPMQEVYQEIVRLEEEISKLEEKLSKSDTTAKDLAEYSDWESKTEEEKQEAVEKQKQKTILYKTEPGDEIVRGTLAKATGNVQKAITAAYIDAIMKHSSIRELQRAIEGIPGIGLLTSFVAHFKCSNGPMFYPPIDSFMNSLTFDPCNGQLLPKFALPAFKGFPVNWNFLELLSSALHMALRALIKQIISALIMKLAQLTTASVCRMAGQAVRDVADGGFDKLLEGVICPDFDDKDAARQEVLTAAGATPASGSDRSYKDLANALSVAATEKEIIAAMLGRPMDGFCNNMSTIIRASVPDFADTFADQDSVCNFFEQMANLLSPNQLDALENSLATAPEGPLNNSLCLTSEELDKWYDERENTFNNSDLAKDFIEKQKERARENLADAAEMLLNGNGDNLGKALEDALAPADPDCKESKSVIPSLPAAQQRQLDAIAPGIFQKLEKAFIDDTIEWNLFSFGQNPPGLLSVILSDKKNRPFNFYNLVNKFWLFKFLFGEGELPETVGSQMRDQILQFDDNYSIEGSSISSGLVASLSRDKYNKLLPYDNGSDDNPFSNTIGIKDYKEKGYVIGGIYKGSSRLRPPEQYNPAPQEYSDNFPFKAAGLKRLFAEQWKDFQNLVLVDSEIKKIYTGMNETYYEEFTTPLISGEAGSNSSQGFQFGANLSMPSEENGDLTYVDPAPGSTKYTFQEEDKVLGRSMTNNPRVNFLDPEVHGGSYKEPAIWIDPAQYTGWMNFMNMVVPDPGGCPDQQFTFLKIEDLMARMKKNKSKIRSHEHISLPPDCLKELPFDRVASSETLATLESIVSATMRVYISEFLIRTFPVFGNIFLRTANFRGGATSYLANTIANDMKRYSTEWPSSYDRYAYLLLFLEQVVQIVKRRLDLGQIKENNQILSALRKCNEAQENYIHVKNVDEIKALKQTVQQRNYLTSIMTEEQYEEHKEKQDKMKERLIQGIGFAALGSDWVWSSDKKSPNWDFVSLDKARFASKLASIHSVIDSCLYLFSFLLEGELQVYFDDLNKNMSPRPYIYDINKYFIGASNILLGKQINAGITKVEFPVGGGTQDAVEYGTVNNCAKRDMEHPLNNISVDYQQWDRMRDRGAFYLEKYLVITQKEGGSIELPDHLSGVVNIEEFQEFLASNQSLMDGEKNISDYFGDAEISIDQTSYRGSIGIKFGVRLCFLPPAGFQPLSVVSQSDKENAVKNRSYYLKEATIGGSSMASSAYSFPLASYEQDIVDDKISNYFSSDQDFNQDLKCYIDNLTETTEFRFLMDNIICTSKLPSALMVYSYENFLYSLGQGDGERDDPNNDEAFGDNQMGKSFNNCKEEAFNLFVSYYVNKDRDPPWELPKFENPSKDFMRQLRAMQINIFNAGEFSLGIRRRLKRTNPRDSNGEFCKNEFLKLFDA